VPGAKSGLIGGGVLALLLAATVAGAVTGDSGGLRASPAMGPEMPISLDDTRFSEYGAAVAWNGTAREFLVVWRDGRSEEMYGLTEIYGRRVSAEGVAQGADFRISGPTFYPGSYKSTPSVAWSDGAGEYLVVWEDARDHNERGWDIYGRRVSADGLSQGVDFRISGPNPLSDDTDPVVASSGSDYLVVWQGKSDPAPRRNDLFGRRVSAEGTPTGGAFRISGRNATVYERNAAVAWNGAEYLVVWEDGRNTATDGVSDLFGRRVSTEGSVVGADFLIGGRNAASYQRQPALAWSGTEYLVVWQDGRNATTRGSDIYGRRLSAEGVGLEPDRRLSGPAATSYERDPAVAWNGTEYLVVWADRRNFTTRGYDIYGRRVSVEGVAQGADFRVSGPDAYGDEGNSAVAADGAGYLVVWEDDRNRASRGWDILGRCVLG
jgi:hypothetical protein